MVCVKIEDQEKGFEECLWIDRMNRNFGDREWIPRLRGIGNKLFFFANDAYKGKWWTLYGTWEWIFCDGMAIKSVRIESDDHCVLLMMSNKEHYDEDVANG